MKPMNSVRTNSGKQNIKITILSQIVEGMLHFAVIYI